MPPKKHFKTQSQELPSALLLNYLQNREAKQNNPVPDSKSKTLVAQFSPSHREERQGFPRSLQSATQQPSPMVSQEQKSNYSLGQRQLETMIMSKQKSQQFMGTRPPVSSNQKPELQHPQNQSNEQLSSQQFSKILQSFMSPKQGHKAVKAQQPFTTTQLLSQKNQRPNNSTQLAQPPKVSHLKTQPHSHQNSISKVPKVEDMLGTRRASEIPQSGGRVQHNFIQSANIGKQVHATERAQKQPMSVIKNSEDTMMKLDIEPILKSVKSQEQLIHTGLMHSKSLSNQFIHLSTKNSSSPQAQDTAWFSRVKQSKVETIAPPKHLNLLLQYKSHKNRYTVDASKNNVGWLIEFMAREVELLEPNNGGGYFVGIKSHNVYVPVDYLLSRRSLQLSVMFNYSPYLHIEPIFSQVPREYQLRQRATLKDFEFIRCIGHGGFSQVYLVREKCNGEYFAMKLVQKQPIQVQGKQSIIQNERDIMANLNHPFIVKMNYAFESRKYLVFILEYCSGGELFYLLRKVKRMSEEEAFFYFAEICLGMKHLHDNHIVYRDIKPENILIDFDGHVRIADFGLSKPHMEPQDVAYSFCGSPEYMAPEMLLKSGHNFQLDLYCLGALLFELITGLPPYYSRDTDEIYNRILNQKLSFPTSVTFSVHVKDILSVLLAKNPKRRISGIRQLLTHPWMQQWGGNDLLGRIEKKLVPPPFTPDPFHFNFDEEEFGQGETQFLIEIKALQEQPQENMPREQLLTSFYYQRDCLSVNRRIKEGTGGTESLHGVTKEQEHMLTNMNSEVEPQSTRNLNKKVPQKQGISSRINTLDDLMEIKNELQGKFIRLQTENDQIKRGFY